MHRGRLLYVIAAWGGRAWDVGVGAGGDGTVGHPCLTPLLLLLFVCLFWFFFTLAALNKEAFFTTCF